MIESEYCATGRVWYLKLPIVEHLIFRSFLQSHVEHLCYVIPGSETERWDIRIFQVNSWMMELLKL